MMVPSIPYLRSLSPREVSGSFRLNENFFSRVVFFDFCAEKDSFSSASGGPSRGVLIVADLKQRPNSLDSSPRRSAAQTEPRIPSVNPVATTVYATRKNQRKNIALFFARKLRHLTTTHLNKLPKQRFGPLTRPAHPVDFSLLESPCLSRSNYTACDRDERKYKLEAQASGSSFRAPIHSLALRACIGRLAMR